MSDQPNRTAREIAQSIQDSGMRCNCDLDKWQPDHSTGHSWVCRIHKAAAAAAKEEGK